MKLKCDYIENSCDTLSSMDRVKIWEYLASEQFNNNNNNNKISFKIISFDYKCRGYHKKLY